MKKIVLAFVALSAFAASSAMAATADHRVSQPAGARSDVVIHDGQVIGQDPDGYVRLELLRTAASPNQG